MGKKRITTQESETSAASDKGAVLSVSKKRVSSGILHVQATFNNTILTLTDKLGNKLFASSSGGLGFKGTKKGTPFAASRVGDLVGERAQSIGIKDVDVIVRGVGPGRESSIRSFMAKGIEVNTIKDATPVPHNGPKAKKSRRV
jgi:small subunit ribosomal protein S11